MWGKVGNRGGEWSGERKEEEKIRRWIGWIAWAGGAAMSRLWVGSGVALAVDPKGQMKTNIQN
jgi:hypothetical protein